MEVLSPEEAARHRAVLQGQEADFGKDGLPRPIGQYHRVNAHLVRGCGRALNRVNLVPPVGSFTPAGLALYEEVLKVQSATLADGAERQVGLYETA